MSVRLRSCGRAAAVVALLGAAGCRKAAVVEPSREARAQAAEIYAKRCAPCHGRFGKGDGPEAAKLQTKPRNFGDPTWQLAISDERLEKVIVQGGPAVNKSAEMPAHRDLANRPEVLAALRQHLRVLVYVSDEYNP